MVCDWHQVKCVHIQKLATKNSSCLPSSHWVSVPFIKPAHIQTIPTRLRTPEECLWKSESNTKQKRKVRNISTIYKRKKLLNAKQQFPDLYFTVAQDLRRPSNPYASWAPSVRRRPCCSSCSGETAAFLRCFIKSKTRTLPREEIRERSRTRDFRGQSGESRS